MAILAICPSRNRPNQAAEVLESFMRTRQDERSRLVFVVDEDDATVDQYPAEYVCRVAPTGKMGGALALAVADPNVLRDATSVGMIGDDNRFHTPGWDVILDGWLTRNIGIAYGDDGFQHERLPTAWWLSRPIVDQFGMAHPGLYHLYMDNYWQQMGEGAKCIRYFPDILIEHLHPLAGKSKNDAIYERSSSPSNINHDRSFFEEWQRGARIEDVRRLVEVVGRDDTVNVLADYHHPALYESLALLFEDRFNWRLYRPVGPEWKNEGYWSFINLDMKLDWPDFLAVNEYKQFDNGFCSLRNKQYPERPHKGVTLYGARSMRWSYIVASVWQNQEGFARFAREQEAVFVHQIGNDKSNINWNLPACYLVSTTTDTGSAKAITYHQEFDTRVYRYEPPQKGKRVANFTCRFDWEKAAYGLFVNARQLAPDMEWTDYGSLYGDIVRQSEVADAMRAMSFIWHDKPMGDGFGHVIHNAASVGRPLVGHGSYYAGKMAGIFWRDLETCIDLDKHSLPEAVELMRSIIGSPAHQRMCKTMAQTFRDNVDYVKEAREIRAFLDARLLERGS